MAQIKLIVVLTVISAFKCFMSDNELEDFKNYLIRTSQLDQNLKKGVNPDDDDEGELVSDHAWEESGKFEGDLILNDRQRRLIVENVAEGLSRNGLTDGTKRWPNNEVIYFIQKEHFTNGQVQAIQEGIDDLARASCVKFRPYIKGDRDAVVIQGSRRGCFSQVGYQGGYQVLNLSGRHPVGRGCFRHGTVVHELLHTLGFYHMQSSPDRDDFIDVLWENIIQPARHNFRKYNSFAVTDFGVGYDYDSVLHYSRKAFSSNGQDTLVPKQRGATIGQRVGLSDKDTKKLNKMYCDADIDILVNDESAPPKPRKNKSTKNKPFDGHGIGYHKGKTVVIKLLPTSETYKLPDDPSFHVFDYFSKRPQILSSSQTGFGIGSEINYSLSPRHNKEYSSVSNILHPRNKYISSEITLHNMHDNRNPNRYDKESEMKKNRDYKKNSQNTNDESSDNANQRYNVQPSQTTDSKLFKFNEDYSDFYIPHKYTKIRELSDESITTPAQNFIESLYGLRSFKGTHETNSSPREKHNDGLYYYY